MPRSIIELPFAFLAVVTVQMAAQAQAISTPLSRTHTPEPATTDITVRDVMTREYIIADHSMEGHDTARRAAWYVDYHMLRDEPQYIDYDRLTRIGQYVRDVVSATTNPDHRPKVDQPARNPAGLCVK